jgi:hypothetical protein
MPDVVTLQDNIVITEIFTRTPLAKGLSNCFKAVQNVLAFSF